MATLHDELDQLKQTLADVEQAIAESDAWLAKRAADAKERRRNAKPIDELIYSEHRRKAE